MILLLLCISALISGVRGVSDAANNTCKNPFKSGSVDDEEVPVYTAANGSEPAKVECKVSGYEDKWEIDKEEYDLSSPKNKPVCKLKEGQLEAKFYAKLPNGKEVEIGGTRTLCATNSGTGSLVYIIAGVVVVIFILIIAAILIIKCEVCKKDDLVFQEFPRDTPNNEIPTPTASPTRYVEVESGRE